MKTQLFAFCFLFFALTLFAAEKQPFERYQSIVDRQAFGKPPQGFNPQRMASEVSKSELTANQKKLTQEQEQIQKSVSVSQINIDLGNIIMVGFTDASNAKSPKHYYLAVGESQDGWLVSAADTKTEKVTLEKDGVVVSLSLGEKGEVAKDAVAGVKPMLGASPMPAPIAGATPSAGAAPAQKLTANAMSFKGRRMNRKIEEEKAEAERAEQRQQLRMLQEEFRRAREEKLQREAEEIMRLEGAANQATGEVK